MKSLKLVLKKKYWDLIASGEKTEEYREVKPYWLHKLLAVPEWDINDRITGYFTVGNSMDDKCTAEFLKESLRNGELTAMPYGYVTCYLGYAKNRPSMTFKIKSVSIDEGRAEWGAESKKQYFVIKFQNNIKKNYV